MDDEYKPQKRLLLTGLWENSMTENLQQRIRNDIITNKMGVEDTTIEKITENINIIQSSQETNEMTE